MSSAWCNRDAEGPTYRLVIVRRRSPLAQLETEGEWPAEIFRALETTRRRFRATEAGVIQQDERRRFYCFNDAGHLVVPLGLLKRVQRILESRDYHIQQLDLRATNPRLESHGSVDVVDAAFLRALQEPMGQFEFASDRRRLELLTACIRHFRKARFQILVATHAESRHVLGHLRGNVSGGVMYNDGARFDGKQPRVIVTFPQHVQPWLCDIIVLFDIRMILWQSAERAYGGVTAPVAIRPNSTDAVASRRQPLSVLSPDECVCNQDMAGTEYHCTTQPVYAFRHAGTRLSHRQEVSIEARIGCVIYRNGPAQLVGRVVAVECHDGPGGQRQSSPQRNCCTTQCAEIGQNVRCER